MMKRRINLCGFGIEIELTLKPCILVVDYL
jgi:hypothetical protein